MLPVNDLRKGDAIILDGETYLGRRTLSQSTAKKGKCENQIKKYA